MNEYTFIAIIVLVAIIIFIICREFNCWYFKINARVNLMQQIIINQEKMIKLLKDSSTETTKQKKSANINKEEISDSEDHQEIKVGDAVFTIVPKYGLEAGAQLLVTGISKDGIYSCAVGNREIGGFKEDEIELFTK